MVEFQAQRIPGRWRDGYVLDLHTRSSTYLGHDEFGHPRFDTQYSPVGELMYRLKYKSDKDALPELIETATAFAQSWGIKVGMVVAVPPSRSRP